MNAALAEARPSNSAFDVEKVRADFPILSREVHGKPLVYLDSAASAQKPRQVIEAETRVYEEEYANVHRGVHYLSQAATQKFEATRTRIASFINAPDENEVVFTRGASEAINLVAFSYAAHFLKEGDEILISELEHHSNIVPWQLAAQRNGAVIRAIPICQDGQIDMAAYADLLGPRTKMVAITAQSNALGIIPPLERMIPMAHDASAKVLVDGCQAITHRPVDVQAMGCDFFAFSGHKIYGPTGVGALWGRAELLEAMPPWQGGGEMIARVGIEKSTYKGIPHRFEAGTPAIAQVIALKDALDYVDGLGMGAIAEHEAMLLDHAVRRLEAMDGVTIIGTSPAKASIVSFLLDGIHPHDIGTIVDREGVAVRVGHHCAQPVMEYYDIAATVRASFGLYNTLAEVDALIASLEKTREIFA
jgi:cysteine desulfurase / selenocysteine lyase